jgi:hypothetical protein
MSIYGAGGLRRMVIRKLRKRKVAEREGCSTRTVDRRSARGQLPPPHYDPGSPIPWWYEHELLANDQRAQTKQTAA